MTKRDPSCAPRARFVNRLLGCLALASLAVLGAVAVPASAADLYKLDLTSPIGKRLANLPENAWVQVNVNEFQDVWTPLDQRPKPPEAPSVGGPWSIIEAWSSMAWDGNRGALIFYGGGHANYPGNDVYRWMATNMQWERASLPSEVYLATGTVLFYAKDGPFNAPAAAHTYDSTEFLPLADRYITFGGASFNTGHYYDLIDGTRTGPYVWDPSRAYPNAVGGTAGSQVKPTVYTSVIGGQMWQNRNNLQPPSASEPRPGYTGTFMINGTSAYTQEGGKDVLYLQDSAELFKYTLVDVNDPTKDTYQRVGRYIRYPFSGQGAGAYDPYRKIFLRTADSTITYWTLTAPGDSNENVIVTPVVTSGTFPFSELRQYGLDFDPIRRVFVLWAGLNDVWALRAPADLATGTWTLEPLSPSSPTAPALTTAHTGILGKWKYAAALDVFLGAFDPNKGQIWAYKPSNWAPSVATPIPWVASPIAGSSFLAGSDINVRADSVDKTVSNIAVYANGVLIGTGSSVPFSFTWRNVAANSYSLTVVATGSDGIQRQSTPVAVSVASTSNSPPTVSLTGPLGGSSYTQGTSIPMTATASDPNVGGSVARVEFWADGAKLGEDTTSPYAFTWSNAAVGPHTLSAVAYDNLGASATSSTVSITVTSTVTNTPPSVTLTAPASGSSYTIGATIGLAATASDPDVGGSVARVEFWANGVKLGEDTTSPYALSWTPTVIGGYTLSAKAFDNTGASTTSATASVTINDVPVGAQTVTLRDGLNGYAGARDTYLYEYHNTVNFGTQTYLQDKITTSRFRSLVAFAIFQSEGGPVPNGATISSAKLRLYKYSAYDTVFRARPLLVNWDEAQSTWQVRSTGVPWSAAGATGAGTDVSASFDAEASAVWNPGWVEFDVTSGVGAIGAGRANYGWVLDPVSGNTNIKQFYSSEYVTDVTLRPQLVISYTVSGGTNTPPTVSLTAPAAGASFTTGTNVTLQATASDPDAGGSVARVEFWGNGAKLGEDTTSPYSLNWTPLATGPVSLTAIAFDNVGASTVSSAVSVSITAPVNTPPSVSLTSPAAGASFASGASIGMTATASDPDVGGSVARVEFWADGAKLGEDTTSPYAFTWAAPSAGQHVLTAVAFDNVGASTTSSSVTVSVAAANTAPSVSLTSPTAGTVYPSGAIIPMTASASDPDVGGSVARVEFWADGAKLGEDTTSPYAYSWATAGAGAHTLTAVAFDNLGASKTSASVGITVNTGTGSTLTVTLQDGVAGYTGTRDTYLYEFHNSLNFGGKAFLEDKATTSRFRSMVRFAIFQSEGGPVPNGATIVSARLSLYKFSSYDYVYRLRPLLVDWVESQATWNVARTGLAWGSAGATGIGTDLATTFDAQASAVWNPGWVDFDVTTGVQAMVSGRANYGWLLEPVSGNSNLKEFQSREYSKDPTLRPKLVVTYQN